MRKFTIFNLQFSIQRGFTLIELLVAISIISTVSVIGIASFLSYSRTQTLNTATMDVVTMLETARSRALTQIKPTSCTQSLEGYTVVLGDSVIGENVYQMNVTCGGNTEMYRKSLPNSISFSVGTPLNLRFLLLGNGVVKVPDLARGDDTEDIVSESITLSGPAGTKTITVYSDGRITYD